MAPGPWQLRTLRNRFPQRWDQDIPGLRDAIVQEMGHYQAAQLAGDFDAAATIAGEAADMVRSIEPAANIVQAMVDQCQALLQRDR